jgi:DNA modification methylase
MSIDIFAGDCRTMLATLADGSVQTCVTSPPYANLRNYGHPDQIGAEATADEYIAELVNVFRQVRRVLRDDGTLWLNLGDGMANKQLRMIPARVALALQADGWWLRSDIIWHKPSCMPEPVTDRPTSAHEHIFLLTKKARYFYDAAAVAEPATGDTLPGKSGAYMGGEVHGLARESHSGGQTTKGRLNQYSNGVTRNLRNVWTIATHKPYSGAHFATMPPGVAELCIKAGTKPGDTVLDPFGGAGTTALVADRLGRNAVLIELNPEYADLARNRLRDDCPMFAHVGALKDGPLTHGGSTCRLMEPPTATANSPALAETAMDRARRMSEMMK